MIVQAYTCSVCKDLLDEAATHYEGDPLYVEHRTLALGVPWGVLLMDFAEMGKQAR